MTMFWVENHREALQAWHPGPEWVLHLDVNKRSGGNEWFSQLLNACREGRMDLEDYSFLHGFPTARSVVDKCTDARCEAYSEKMAACM